MLQKGKMRANKMIVCKSYAFFLQREHARTPSSALKKFSFLGHEDRPQKNCVRI